ncbi:unnamed protein product, partial [Mesorhabditis belari]|uniref:UNC93-like protein MFSD11 n=1 Tax=Mesorhabditis belari TaxID=2138241 RepID=A0AAF3JAE1_9BILA
MKDDNFTILASALLGALQMAIFFGFDIMTFTVGSVMHSVQSRCPDCLIDFAGYYGQCILYIVYTFSNLIAPVILERTSIKTTLVLGSASFAIFCGSFFLVRTWIYFAACVIAGFGFSLYYVGAGAYSAKHSTQANFSRNAAITWMCAGSTMIPNALFMIISAEFSKSQVESGNVTQTTQSNEYRDYSDFEIRMLTTGTIVTGIGSVLLAYFLPNRVIPDSIYSKRKAAEKTLKGQLKTIWWALCQKGMVKLIPLHVFTGLFAAYWLSIYTTTIAFTASFSEYSNLIAYSCMAFAIGEILLGFCISFANRHVKDFGLWPVLFITCSSFMILAILLVLFVPPESPMHPTNENSFFEPSVVMAVVMGGLNGVVDGSMNNCRMVASAKALPSHPAVAFSLAKFYQAAASAVFYYVSSLFTIYQLVILLATPLLIGLFTFSSLMKDIQEEEKGKLSEKQIPKIDA